MEFFVLDACLQEVHVQIYYTLPPESWNTCIATGLRALFIVHILWVDCGVTLSLSNSSRASTFQLSSSWGVPLLWQPPVCVQGEGVWRDGTLLRWIGRTPSSMWYVGCPLSSYLIIIPIPLWKYFDNEISWFTCTVFVPHGTLVIIVNNYL